MPNTFFNTCSGISRGFRISGGVYGIEALGAPCRASGDAGACSGGTDLTERVYALVFPVLFCMTEFPEDGDTPE